MFDIGWSELALIAVVALVAIGPKELPGVLRTVGQWAGKIRRMASEFQGQFQEALREAEMGDLKDSFDEVRKAASGFSKGTLITSLQRDVTNALRIDDAEKPMDAQAAPAPVALVETSAADAAVADTSISDTSVADSSVAATSVTPVTEAPAVHEAPAAQESFLEAADGPAASEPLAVTPEAGETKPATHDAAQHDTPSDKTDVLKNARAS